MSRLIRYFFQGLIFSVPIALTGYIFYASFITIDRWFSLPIPGLGVLIVVVMMVVVGFLATLFITAPLMRLVERIIARLPFAKLLYSAVKDLLSAVVGDERRFEQPVLVRVGEGIEIIGFVTRDSLDELGLADRVAVYLPQSYNFAGQTLVVPRDRVSKLAASGADAMRFIVSAGIAKSD